MIYPYPNKEGDIFTLAIKITDRILGFQPKAIGRDTNGIYIEFESELTSEQKTTLDAFMAQSDCCQIPANVGNTNFIFTDPLEFRKTLRTNFGIDFDIYMTPTT